MHISIKTLKGKRINLEVEDSSNTIDLKIHGNGQPINELVLRLGPGQDRDREVMKIFLKTLTGKTLTLEVKDSDTIGDVKAKYAEMDGTPVDQQRIIFQGRQLVDSLTIADYYIKHESVLVMMMRLCGC